MSYTINDNLKIIEQSPLNGKYTDIQELYSGDIDNTNVNGEIDVQNYSILGFYVDVDTIAAAENVKLNIYFRNETGSSDYHHKIYNITYNENKQLYIPISCETTPYIYYDVQADVTDASSLIIIKINKKYI